MLQVNFIKFFPVLVLEILLFILWYGFVVVLIIPKYYKVMRSRVEMNKGLFKYEVYFIALMLLGIYIYFEYMVEIVYSQDLDNLEKEFNIKKEVNNNEKYVMSLFLLVMIISCLAMANVPVQYFLDFISSLLDFMGYLDGKHSGKNND